MPARSVPEGGIKTHYQPNWNFIIEWSTLYLMQFFPFWLPVSLLILWQMSFFSQHGCTSSAANAKYNSRAAQLYREKIKTLASQATRRHGTEVIRTCFFIVLKQLPQWWLPVFAEALSLTAQTAVSVLLLFFCTVVARLSGSSLPNIARWQAGGFLQSAFTGTGECLLCLGVSLYTNLFVGYNTGTGD